MGFISEIILFTSQTSVSCRVCVNLVKEYDLPIKIVRLDTEEARRKAKYNKKISITKVPTLAVIFDDDDIKIYIGSEKICKWIRNFKQQTDAPPEVEVQQPESKRNVTVIETNSDEDAPELNSGAGDEGIQELDMPVSEEPKPATSSKMQSLLEKAKEMEEAAKKTLGGDAFSRRNDYT